MPTGKGFLRIAVEDFLETFSLGTILGKWYKEFIEGLEKEAADVYQKMAELYYPDGNIPLPFQPQRVRTIILSSQNGIWMFVWSSIGLLLGGVFGLARPTSNLAAYKADMELRSGRANPIESFTMVRRGKLTNEQAMKFGSHLGFPDMLLNGYDELSRNYLTLVEYIMAWRRQGISDSVLRQKAQALGYEADDIDIALKITEVIPTPNDLIYLQVKEAFNDTASQRFHHDEGDTSQVREWAKKQGLSEDWVKRYWRAHWNSPSPQQVFEMLQRLRPGTTDNPVTMEDVKTYLQMADYSPFWRERLTEISYLPFTRVDVRRMYKTRTLDENGVKQAYLDNGYDEKHAQALTEFTIAYEAEEETGIVRQSVISAYSDGMIDRAKASSMLKSGGYDDISIAFYLDSVDFDQQQQTNKVILNSIKAKYINGDLDETSVNNEINKLNLPSERTLALLEQWTIARDNQIQQPTQSQVEKFVELGIATIEDYKRISKLRGYTEESIEWNIKRIQIELQAQAAKNAADAAKEMERVLKDKDNSQYQVDKADIELAIAQAKEQITDIDIALQSEENPDTIAELGQTKNDLKSFIASMNTAKAQLKYDFQLDKERLGTSNGG